MSDRDSVLHRPGLCGHPAAGQERAAAASPALAGHLLGASAFGWPLIVGGALKIVYDILLLTMFSRVQPPEELPSAGRLAKTG